MSKLEEPDPREKIVITPVAKARFEVLLEEREAIGLKTYGRTLHTFNGRDAVKDAEEELVDLWKYLTQIRLEKEALLEENRQLREALRLAQLGSN